jgi:hypothetical protein
MESSVKLAWMVMYAGSLRVRPQGRRAPGSFWMLSSGAVEDWHAPSLVGVALSPPRGV